MNTCESLSRSALWDMFGVCRGVVFDCDGVMVDSFDSNLSYYNLMLGKLGFAPMTPEQENYVHIHTAAEGLRYIIPEEYHERIPQMIADFDYRDVLPSLRLEEGLVELLDFLRDRGIRLGINTNRSTTMDMVLEHFGLAEYFNPVITAGKVKAKPDPEGMFTILSHWEMPAKHVVFVGDSTLDQLASNGADVPFWAFRNGELEADLHVDGFPPLLACWKALQAGAK